MRGVLTALDVSEELHFALLKVDEDVQLRQQLQVDVTRRRGRGRRGREGSIGRLAVDERKGGYMEYEEDEESEEERWVRHGGDVGMQERMGEPLTWLARKKGPSQRDPVNALATCTLWR